MTRRRTGPRWAVGAAAAAVAVTAAGFAVFGASAHPAPVDTYVSTSSAGAPPPASGLRQVHSPGRVEVDEQLHAGGCRVHVVDGATGLVLPDPACTPGSVDPAVTQANIGQTICRPGYTTTVRPPESDTGPAKHESLADYGLHYTPSIEYDHLVPLELGGANAVSNLWPEPNTADAHGTRNPKDSVENRLREAVCVHQVTLAAAQQAIAADWTAALARLGIEH
ncbi:hypothetical protein GCM10027414_36870 [Humibacter ginsengiterrae]